MLMNGLNRLTALSYNKPVSCDECGTKDIEYKGIGEYVCNKCGKKMYDDYGKVRNYLEENPGATQSEVARATGVSKPRIQQMLKDDKIEISPSSSVFLFCEMCGTEIRSGRYCIHCSAKASKAASEDTRKSSIIGGFAGKRTESGTGAKRFNR